ncbi:MAG: alpha-hydroxy acid oxidase [Acidimicrobiia bacterium]
MSKYDGFVARLRKALGPLGVFQLARPEFSPQRRRLSRAVSVADLRRLARRRLPRGVFDYIDGGAGDELTMRANQAAYGARTFAPRVLRDVGQVDTSSTLLGEPVATPIVLAPTGFTRIVHPDGELAVARAAARAQIPYSLSTLSTRSIEEVASVSDGRLWFQVYPWRDRRLVSELVARARDAGYEALCLTVDTPVLGRRERDIRRGFTLPPKVGLVTLLDGMVHPSWAWRFLTSEPIVFANVAGRGVGDGSDAVSLAEYVGRQFDPTLTWDIVGWLRDHWEGRIVLKGIQTVEDAVLAAEHEADAIVISNHGGRQLDSAPATLDLFPAVVDAVEGRLEVICDGGVRRGSDVVKAVALGARAVMLGRPYLYGLAAGGETGVDELLATLQVEMAQTMALIGCARVGDLSPAYLASTG